LACVSRRVTDHIQNKVALAPAPALVAALLVPAGTTLVLPEPPFRMTLALDAPSAMLLGVSALLWIVAGAYASLHLRSDPNAGRFAEWWLLTLVGNLGVFIAADLVSFYLTFSVVSLAAWGLIAHDSTSGSRRAGVIYVALAVLSEAFLLMAFVFMAQAIPDGSLLIRDAVAALPASPWRNASLVLLILGFGLKIGLVPGHVWMPLAYTAAPIPAAAVLSGAAVKSGVIGLIRFMPLGFAMPEWGGALAVAGIFSAFYGVLVGITQQDPRTVLAYSSVSQMGLLTAALGMGLAAGDIGAAPGVSFSAAHHVLAKGALFLAIGVSATAGPRLWPVLVPAAVVALGLGGLPFTGGMLAKLAVKTQFGDQVFGTLTTLSAVTSTVLMLHFLRCLVRATARDRAPAAPTALMRPWLVLAFAAVVVPWILYSITEGRSLLAAVARTTLWAALWPVLLGALLAALLWPWGDRLPRLPAGDVVVVGEAAIRATVPWGAAIEQADGYLRQWPVAGLSLLMLVIVLGAAMLAWG